MSLVNLGPKTLHSVSFEIKCAAQDGLAQIRRLETESILMPKGIIRCSHALLDAINCWIDYVDEEDCLTFEIKVTGKF